MKWLRFRIIIGELIAATHLVALGSLWQASARHRLGKLSGDGSHPLKSGGPDQSRTPHRSGDKAATIGEGN